MLFTSLYVQRCVPFLALLFRRIQGIAIAFASSLVVYIWGFWDSYFPRFSLIFPHFFLKLKSRTTFQILLNILKKKKQHRYIIQLHHHHMIYLTNSYKSSQLNSISLKSSVLYPTSKTYSSPICSIKATNYFS